MLNQCAAAELTRHDCEHAEALAEEALAADEAVQRITEVAVARTILLRAATTNGNDEAAALQLVRLAALGAGQNLSARAQALVELAYGSMPQSLQRRFQR